MIIDLNLDELYYYLFTISMSKCNGICNTVDDPFGRCVPNKIKDTNLKMFDMIKVTNESRTLAKHISCKYRCEFDGRECNSRQKWNNDKCQCDYKKSIKPCACEENYV